MELAEHFLQRMLSAQLKPNEVCLRSLQKVYVSMKACDRLSQLLRRFIHNGEISPVDVKKALKSGDHCRQGRACQESRAIQKLLHDISRTSGMPDAWTPQGPPPSGLASEFSSLIR
eukprot:TRINITY_DN49346_c0_g1_i1.p1 TRINITY_DN49346_c0_g1~~TRINITY_DN49346_c0_g1_i1.p1  ORF type:complete len:126 (-),score=13.35 TRINITY_DN49346_c0_g1_i1:37-384(-)